MNSDGCSVMSMSLVFSQEPGTPYICTLSLHDALPISTMRARTRPRPATVACTSRPTKRSQCRCQRSGIGCASWGVRRSEEHTSELQSQFHLVCRLLLEKKNGRLTFTG